MKHASAVGARTFCGSSGVGWFYAFEAITVTAGLRMPVVAMVGNRALDDPGAFGVEHNDAMAVRDLGWHLYWGGHGPRGDGHGVAGLAGGRRPQRAAPLRHQL